ncbi:DivIVA domain-containing protein [uncultured Ruminococcus sp.]|uniref:DivIVA domain-containing protein n=1 Tax=Ruminococcus sp. TaxID=41978 RepID=UPI0026653D59|nr:DivIVA domain-containing protein [uncultured Ruminococcus sp.]
MISASEIHELRFEKAAFGYKQEDIDEFLNRLEEEVDAAQRELEDSNNKIQVLADKVREYMRDEDALKDALLGAQKEGHRIIAEANAKADDIIAKAKAKADAMMDEVTVQHDALIEKNEAEIKAEHEKLAAAKKQVADFKKALFEMYKDHIKMVSTMPDEDDSKFGVTEEAAPKLPETEAAPSASDPFATAQFSAKTIQGAYDSRFGDLQDSKGTED